MSLPSSASFIALSSSYLFAKDSVSVQFLSDMHFLAGHRKNIVFQAQQVVFHLPDSLLTVLLSPRLYF
ncbi:hypothetical protein DUNSADRAFT_15389 [Dunaliella salina]|uniref:Encoded protein n=1 Tax=Dunaliella salina TaxID=3046 RepID=A0ABQ7G5I3_DUNSA|nr:hypothetical protein DUNSADRAFT_15389 [Dunaliella salina]|eukprot:KAF5829873.1 hypothetical protein DUNSADRAFT_15389 [Dunaliella salina]